MQKIYKIIFIIIIFYDFCVNLKTYICVKTHISIVFSYIFKKVKTLPKVKLLKQNLRYLENSLFNNIISHIPYIIKQSVIMQQNKQGINFWKITLVQNQYLLPLLDSSKIIPMRYQHSLNIDFIEIICSVVSLLHRDWLYIKNIYNGTQIFAEIYALYWKYFQW